MSTLTEFEIRAGESFPHLPHAPIVEAVIDLQARAVEKLEDQTCRSTLEAQLQGYRYLDSQREYQAEVKMEGGNPPSQTVRDLGWKGLRFQSTDQKHIGQFNRDGFVFSRLEPYVNWQQLQDEAFRLWEVFKLVARPVEIRRVGLRFINRIRLAPSDLRFEDYIRPAPEPPSDLNLPFHGFVHQDTLAVPGHPYAVNVIRTIQPAGAFPDERIGVILDIDVFTTHAIETNDEMLARHLGDMRWLKNKVFFGSITEKALEGFR
jgi:uncharacterized protein (TIGR04255 family)